MGYEERLKASVDVRGEASFPITRNWSMEQLLALTKAEAIKLWSDAPAVTLDELQGHFMGIIPNAGDPEFQEYVRGYMYDEDQRQGYWLGKAYRKTGQNQGEGYNNYRMPDGTIERKLRFTTAIANSYFDGKPSLMMYYGAYRPDDPTFVDEIRKLEDRIYLGVGSRLIDGKRDPGHFMLVGPIDRWIGGAIGELVPGFVPPEK